MKVCQHKHRKKQFELKLESFDAKQLNSLPVTKMRPLALYVHK